MDYVPTPPPTMNMHHRTIAFVGNKEFLSECRNHVISSLPLPLNIFKEDYISFPETTFYFLDPEKIINFPETTFYFLEPKPFLGRRFTVCYVQEGTEGIDELIWPCIMPDGKLYIAKNSKDIISRA